MQRIMRIKIDSLEFMYDFLKNPSVKESGEAWKPEETRPLFLPFPYPPASLDYPLDDISVSFKRFGENYSVVVPIDSKDCTVFLGTYDTFKKFLEPLDYTFRPQYDSKNKIIDTSIGRIRRNGNNEFSLFPVTEGRIRLLAMGSFGAYTRSFPNNTDAFIKEVRTLESVVNLFLKCLLQPFADSLDKDSDDEVIYLNP